MYTKILIPLDGSPTAEQALPLAAGIARREQSEVTLLCIVPPMRECERARADTRCEAAQSEAREYLTRIARGLNEQGLRVRTAIEFGVPAEVILDFAHSMAIDLIVMCLPDGSGADSELSGQVAERVLHGTNCPVLLAPSGHYIQRIRVNCP